MMTLLTEAKHSIPTTGGTIGTGDRQPLPITAGQVAIGYMLDAVPGLKTLPM